MVLLIVKFAKAHFSIVPVSSLLLIYYDINGMYTWIDFLHVGGFIF